MPVDVTRLLTRSTESTENAVPIRPLTADAWRLMQDAANNSDIMKMVKIQGFKGNLGETLIVTDEQGNISTAYVRTDSLDDMWSFSGAAAKLPKGVYYIDDQNMSGEQRHKAAVGWALARYSWKIKKGVLYSNPAERARLIVPDAFYEEAKNEIEATWKVRDLINAPTNVLNTEDLAKEVVDLASEFNAAATVVKGEELEREFPLVDAVGRASESKPCLVHFPWQGSGTTEDSPTILIVGKGIAFDSGGLQIKPGASMEGMKKDMGGAATAMGLARMVMANDLPVRIKVVIPIAENAIAGNAFRPMDVITARDGTEVEISHTDAEGRLILADALSFGVEESNPDLIFDFATLTGAQRVADGLEVGGVFSNSKDLGRKMMDLGIEWCDDLQDHHLFEKYRSLLKSKNGGDLCSSPKSGGGPGATLAAMFLQHSIRAAREGHEWFHYDINGANASSKPGRPAGGEAIGMRAAYQYIKMKLGL